MQKLATLSLLAMVVLSGCTNAPQPAESQSVQPEAYPGVKWICPDGSDGNPCAATLQDRLTSQQEPFAAIHPTDASVMAIGVNAGHTANGVVADADNPGFDMVRLDIWFTTDTGATWSYSTLPHIHDTVVSQGPFHTSVIGDPAIVIDGEGVTHVSGIASHSLTRGYNVFYTQSPDYGVSWSEPIVLTDDDDNDRNWMDMGPDGTLYVAWQNVGDSVEVAISNDGGATWGVTAPYEDCITVSPVVFADDRAIVACSAWRDDRIHILEIIAGELQFVSKIDADCYWPKLSVVGETFIMTGEYCGESALLATSADLVDWDKSDMAAVLGVNANEVLWQTTDRLGRVHFLLGTDVGRQYVGYDARQQEILLQLVVDETESLQDAVVASTSNSLGPDYGDHYYGIDWQDDGPAGLTAWTEHRTIRWALLGEALDELG